jgi:ABC-type nickel/cobalt efflux system permease component RcnA
MNREGPIKNTEIGSDTQRRRLKHRARIAYLLVWTMSSVGMFIAVAVMLFKSGVNAQDPVFYIPVAAFALIMAIAIPLTAKITRLYSD